MTLEELIMIWAPKAETRVRPPDVRRWMTHEAGWQYDADASQAKDDASAGPDEHRWTKVATWGKG